MASFTCSFYVTPANETILVNLGIQTPGSPLQLLTQYLVATTTTTPTGTIWTGDASEVKKLTDYVNNVFSNK